MYIFPYLFIKINILWLPSYHTDNLLQTTPMDKHKRYIYNPIYRHTEKTVKHPAADDENATHQQIFQYIKT